jgi:RNA polymerase sigma-70 factor (ECF subfamily)
MTDGQLLGAFVERRDGAAFAALVRRHGPMVWAVCRRLLPHHDAEDAFQAAFLILVRKATSLEPREKVGNWLYGVAHHTALLARRTTTRRNRREKQTTELPEPALREKDLWSDLQPLVDEELSRLPEKYRTVLVLCDLEGNTRTEAARRLGVPDGSVASRLARARASLAKRLARRGVTLSGGLLAGLQAQGRALAVMPPSIVSATVSAARVLAAGTGSVGAKITELTNGVLNTMLLNKLKSVIAVSLVVLACIGGFVIVLPLAAEQPPPASEKRDTKSDAISVAALAELPAEKNILRNGSFEEGDKNPAHWSQGADLDGVQYVWDKKTGRKGKASVCLHKTAKRYFPIAQWYQIVDRTGDLPALRVAAQVKAEEVTKAIIDVIFLDENGEALSHKWVEYIGAKEASDKPVSHDWKEYAGRVEIPAKTKKFQICLQIYGPGKVWFDDVQAEYVK